MAFWITSDEKLMSRVQTRGDEAAFAELVRRWQGRLEQASFRILNDRHRSEDLVQEAFTRLFLKRDQFRPDARFGSYLWRITINLCQDELRRQQSAKQHVIESDDPEAMNSVLDMKGNPGRETERLEEAAAVRKALTTLPDQVRIIVVMRHFEDLKFREIAAALNLPEGTVKTRMVQGLSLLAKQLRPINDADSVSKSNISTKTHLSSTL
jgi:RNA polymerase sigma-70 factor (ECF subfamily)